ncbi:MAG: TonB-dependent receptor [Pseudomonadota bacterium]
MSQETDRSASLLPGSGIGQARRTRLSDDHMGLALAALPVALDGGIDVKYRSLLCGVACAALAWSVPVVGQDAAESDGQLPAEEECCWTPVASSIRPPDTILVSATRSGTLNQEEYLGSATIIGSDDIVNRQTRDIADVLRDVPGVAVSSVPGQTQLRLRGSEGNHVLVLVDGIEVSDPFGGEFDIGTLQAEMYSSVEVLRGPQSSLYGSDAIGGVVSYRSTETSRWRGLSGRVEAGSFGTINGSARYAIGNRDWGLALNGTVVSTNGTPNAREGERNIGRDSYTVSGKGDVAVADNFELRAVGRYILTEGDFNDSDSDTASPTFGLIIDSPGTRFENEAVYGLIGAKLSALNGSWTHDVSAQFADIGRASFNALGRSSGSEGHRLKASYVSSYEFGYRSRHTIAGAIDWERERFRNNDPFGVASTIRQEIENVGLVGEYRFNDNVFDASVSIRHDINDRFADETTFKVAAGAKLSRDIRARASVGSGIKNPGFFELFGFFDGRFVGNEELQPENSTEWEIGADWQLDGRRTMLSAVYFQSELENEIFTTFPAPDFIATPGNRDTVSRRKGVEVSFAGELDRQFSIDAAYTYLDSQENGVEEVRRPNHIASAALNWQHPNDIVSATLVVRYNGETDDLAFTDPSFVPVRETLDDYTLVNFNASVELTDGLDMFARVENILGETYEQVFSFVSPGRSATIGVSARF